MLHSFARDIDGTYPQDSVAIDQSGGIYGTTTYGGTGEGGTLWKYWRESGNLIVLHSFALGDDGGDLPAGPRIEKRTGVVWGTTKYGPNCNYCGPGTVWNYDPPSGTFTTIADFDSQVYAPLSRLILDNEGNAYGTSGNGCCGGVYELPKNDNYIPVAIYEFKDDADGASPYGRVRFDEHGNLLGTTTFGGDFGVGTVYKLTNKNGTWHKTILHSFAPWEAYQSVSGLKTDHKGNWFGTAAFGGIHDSGTVFEISGVH